MPVSIATVEIQACKAACFTLRAMWSCEMTLWSLVQCLQPLDLTAALHRTTVLSRISLGLKCGISSWLLEIKFQTFVLDLLWT